MKFILLILVLLTSYGKYGNTYKPDDILRLSGKFNLGCLFNLSWYTPYSFLGANVALAIFRYTYEIKDGGFSAEIGNTWNGDDEVNYNMMKKSASIYVAADTLLGPLYLAFASCLNGHMSGYLYLGEKF